MVNRAHEGFGRLPEFDEASRAFPARALLTTADGFRTRTWRRGAAYNQGSTPHCVAHTGKGLLNTAPLSAAVDYDIRSKYSTDALYAGAQRLDEWPGENYDGTSALGLCKYLTETGRISEYRWCFGLTDVLRTLSNIGPVGIGIWWYESMLVTNSSGYVFPYGQKVGGHEVELIGIDVASQSVIGMNSWGTDWGINGRFRLTFDHLRYVLEDEGDAVVILK